MAPLKTLTLLLPLLATYTKLVRELTAIATGVVACVSLMVVKVFVAPSTTVTLLLLELAM